MRRQWKAVAVLLALCLAPAVAVDRAHAAARHVSSRHHRSLGAASSPVAAVKEASGQVRRCGGCWGVPGCTRASLGLCRVVWRGNLVVAAAAGAADPACTRPPAFYFCVVLLLCLAAFSSVYLGKVLLSSVEAVVQC